jgi:hypothetical protein
MSTEPVKVFCFDTLLQVLILKVVAGGLFHRLRAGARFPSRLRVNRSGRYENKNAAGSGELPRKFQGVPFYTQEYT